MNGRLQGLKDRWFPRGFRRTATRYVNRTARRVTRESLARSLADLRIEPGAVICIHSALRRLGHLPDGPETVIRAVQDAVPGCTIMMPTFPFSGPAAAYVAADPVYDPVGTPSRVGLLSEALRHMSGVHRSLHPTHPCAVLGPHAGALIDGSEWCATPFGDSSTYGRFADRDDAVVLLIDTNSGSVAHRFQEIVGMPNLFIDRPRAVRAYDRDGRARTYTQYIHRPVLPLYVALSRDESGTAEYLWIADYLVQFPRRHARHVLARVRSAGARRFLAERQREFFAAGTFRQTRHGGADILAIRVRPWQERVCHDLRQNLAAFADCYALDAMQSAQRRGLLQRHRP